MVSGNPVINPNWVPLQHVSNRCMCCLYFIYFILTLCNCSGNYWDGLDEEKRRSLKSKAILQSISQSVPRNLRRKEQWSGGNLLLPVTMPSQKSSTTFPSSSSLTFLITLLSCPVTSAWLTLRSGSWLPHLPSLSMSSSFPFSSTHLMVPISDGQTSFLLEPLPLCPPSCSQYHLVQ